MKKKEKHKRSFFKKAFIIMLVSFLAACVLFVSFTLIIAQSTLKDFNTSKITDVSETLLIYDREGNQAAGIYALENRLKIPLAQVPKHVQNALIAIEDERFYTHPGFDVKRIIGAFVANLKSGSLSQGGSTITQQLIKLSHLTGEKKYSRKIEEAIMAYQLERLYSKDEILEMYLNYVYFGNGAYGIEAAAQVYFDKPASDLTLNEGAALIGTLKSPTNYAPHLNMENNDKRRNLVLSAMEKNDYISNAEYLQLKKEPITLAEKKSRYPNGYFTDVVMEQAASILSISIEDLLTGGYRIHTTMDASLQTAAEMLMLDESLFPPTASDGVLCEAAFVAIEPTSGEVMSVVGGREHYTRRGFNRATQQYRQPGSAIKPVIVYAPAVERYGYTAATMVLDERHNWSGYSPRNFDDKYNGWVLMRTAVAKSLNVPAVRILNAIGVENGKKYASSVGIPFDKEDNNLSLALGGFTTGVSPLQLCGSYTPFANGGTYTEPYFIRSITDREGNVLYAHKGYKNRVLRNENAFIITSMLQSVVDGGTGRRLNDLNMDLAGKTGTSSLKNNPNNKDAWMVAYNSDMVCTVWMGFDTTDETHFLPGSATGGTYPAQYLKGIFNKYYEDKTPPRFEAPSGVIEAQLDLLAIQKDHEVFLANSLTPPEYILKEYFTEGSLPTKVSWYWTVPSPPSSLSVSEDANGNAVISFAADS
ncbi:MAG: transglycosylase domain-containing protein, partial [Christensenellales bacterium]